MKARPAPIRLDPRKVQAWRLARQHLTIEMPAASPEEVARDLVGVQAQVLSAAALSIAVRSERLGVDALPAALNERRVVRSWAMRGTLHVFASDDYPTIVAALRRREMWRRPAWLRWFGMSEEEMEALIETIGEILADGWPRTRAELSDAVAQRFGPVIGDRVRSGWGSYLKPAADRGYICQAGVDGSRVAFTRPDRWLPAWRDEDPDTAMAAVVGRYIAAYGPATMGDIRLWWGTQPGLLRPAIAALGDALAHVEVDGARGLVREADVPAIEATPPLTGSLRLLGPFDPLIIRGGLREQTIPPAHLDRVSRTAGWISPVLLLDGIVAGVWASELRGTVLRLTVDPFAPLAARERRALDREVELVAARHGAEAQLELGPVFTSPPRADRLS